MDIHTYLGWPSFRGGHFNNGVRKINFKSILNTAQPLVFKTDGVIWGTPVIDNDGNIYFGSADRNFFAIRPDGSLIWKYKSACLP